MKGKRDIHSISQPENIIQRKPKKQKLNEKEEQNNKISKYFKQKQSLPELQSLRKCDKDSNQKDIEVHASNKREKDENEEKAEILSDHNETTEINIESNCMIECIKCNQQFQKEKLNEKIQKAIKYIKKYVCDECAKNSKTYTSYHCIDDTCNIQNKQWISKNAYNFWKEHMIKHHCNEMTLSMINHKFCESEECIQVIDKNQKFCENHKQNQTSILNKNNDAEKEELKNNDPNVIIDGNKEYFNIYDSMYHIDIEQRNLNIHEKHTLATIIIQSLQKITNAHNNLSKAIEGALQLRFYAGTYAFMSNRGNQNKRKNEKTIRQQLYENKKWGQLLRRITCEQAKRNDRFMHKKTVSKNKHNETNNKTNSKIDMAINSVNDITNNETLINENTLNNDWQQMKYNVTDTKQDIKNRIKRCVSKIQNGQYKKGMDALGAGTIADLDRNDNWHKTMNKFPKEEPLKSQNDHNNHIEHIEIELQQIKKDIENLNNKSSGGNLGFDNRILQYMNNHNETYQIREIIKSLCETILKDGLPKQVRDLMMYARGLPLGKAKDGISDFDIRPIVICNVIIRLIDKVIMNALGMGKIRNAIGQEQVINVNSGIEIATASVRMAETMLKLNSSMCLLNLDAQNAFNSVSRQQQYQHVLQDLPEIRKYYEFLYAHPIKIQFDHTHTLNMERGDIQGLHSSMVLYALTKRKVQQKSEKEMKQIQPNFQIYYQTDYVDDGLTMHKYTDIPQYVKILEANYKENGININFEKTKIIMNVNDLPTIKTVQQCISNMNVITNGNFTYLGVQYGQQTFIDDSIDQFCNETEKKLLYIHHINDRQIQQLLLRKFFSYNKLIFILKTAKWVNGC